MPIAAKLSNYLFTSTVQFGPRIKLMPLLRDSPPMTFPATTPKKSGIGPIARALGVKTVALAIDGRVHRQD
jgi:hypothetical protein